MDEILFILLIITAIWYWWDTQKSNEIALAICRRKCSKAHLQLLDSTVTRQRSWLRRGPNGYIQICRLYSFEYNSGSTDFGERLHGYIVLIGKQVVETHIPEENAGTERLH